MQKTNEIEPTTMSELTAAEAEEVVGGLMSPIGDVLFFLGSDEYFSRTQVGAIG